jgi:hypothetical protein
LATRPWPGEEGRVFLNEVDDGSEAPTVVKLANNLVLGCAMIAMAEGFSLVRKYGVEPQVLYEVMTEGLFSLVRVHVRIDRSRAVLLYSGRCTIL